MELGSIAELASAAAGGTGTILSIFALSYARGANATAEQTRLDMKEDAEKNREITSEREKKLDLKQSEVDRRESDREDREKKRVEDEIAREKRNMAGSLQAWWAKHGDDWGVIVSNRGPAATVFHDVAIRCTGNHYGTAITFETFPPGVYFVKSGDKNRKWGFPIHVATLDNYESILKSPDHKVEQVRFSDPAGETWEWTPKTGIRTVDDA